MKYVVTVQKNYYHSKTSFRMTVKFSLHSFYIFLSCEEYKNSKTYFQCSIKVIFGRMQHEYGKGKKKHFGTQTKTKTNYKCCLLNVTHFILIQVLRK